MPLPDSLLVIAHDTKYGKMKGRILIIASGYFLCGTQWNFDESNFSVLQVRCFLNFVLLVFVKLPQYVAHIQIIILSLTFKHLNLLLNGEGGRSAPLTIAPRIVKVPQE